MVKQTREQLGVKPGDRIILKGKVSFARIDKLVEGEALARENDRRAKIGMMPTKPFRSITIEEPEIVKGQGTPLANYYGQTVYTSKASGKKAISIDSKSLFAPQYGHIQNGKVVQIPDPKKNPAPGQVVYLYITAFAPKGFNRIGSTFDAIVFEEGDIKFYEGTNSLVGFGQEMNMPVETMPQEQTQSDTHQFSEPETNTQEEQTSVPTSNPFDEPAADPFADGAADNPFDVQDGDMQTSPFGSTNNSGQSANSPFA